MARKYSPTAAARERNTSATDGRSTWIVRFWNQLQEALSYTSVEPILLCRGISAVLVYLCRTEQLLRKSCQVNLNYSQEICDALKSRQVGNYTEEDKNVQKLTAHISAWSSAVEQVIPIIIVLFIGSWSDRFGRKLWLLVPLVGFTIQTVGLLLNDIYQEWSAEVSALSAVLPIALTGSLPAINLAMYTHLADISSNESKTFRIGVGAFFAKFGSVIASACASGIFKAAGLSGALVVAAVMYVLCFVYALFWIREPPREPTSPRALLSLFDVRHVWMSLKTTLKKREGNLRMYILLVLLIFFLHKGQNTGEWAILQLHNIYRYRWTTYEHSLFLTFNQIMNVLGVFLCFGIFSKVLKMSDIMLGSLAAVSRLASAVISALAFDGWAIYLGAFVNTIHAGMFPLDRSLISKMVPSDELGKVNALYNVIDATVRLISRPTYLKVYSETLSSYPGFVFILSAALCVPSLAIFISLYVLERRRGEPVMEIKYLPPINDQTANGAFIEDQNISSQDNEQSESIPMPHIIKEG